MTMQLTMVIPEIDFFLLVELTTNIEDYVFMSLSDVTKAKGSAITFNGTGTVINHSSQNNNEVDRVEINFGFVSVRYELCVHITSLDKKKITLKGQHTL